MNLYENQKLYKMNYYFELHILKYNIPLKYCIGIQQIYFEAVTYTFQNLFKVKIMFLIILSKCLTSYYLYYQMLQ